MGAPFHAGDPPDVVGEVALFLPPSSMDAPSPFSPAPMPAAITPIAAVKELPPFKKRPALKWVKQWVTQDTVLGNGKCSLLKWVSEDSNSYKTKQQLEGDQDVDSEYEVVYVCTFESCGKVFTDAGSLRKHAHVHGEKQYICSYEGCGRRFMDSSKLKRHHLIHTGEKHFVCSFEGCRKAFSLDFNLRNHMRTHTLENYHTCTYCGKRYAHEYKLRSHLRAHHDKNLPEIRSAALPIENEIPKVSPATAAAGDRPFACPHEGCEKRYIHEYKLNLHLRTAHAKDEIIEETAVNGRNSDGEDVDDESDADNTPKAPGIRRGSGKGKLRIISKSAPMMQSKRQRTTVPSNLNQRLQAAAVLVSRKANGPRNERPEDSEETEDEGHDDDEDGVQPGGEYESDDEETEDDMD